MFTLAFLKGASERAIKTFAQTLAGMLTAGTLGILDVDWGNALSVAGLVGLASLLTSVGNAEFTAGTDRGHIDLHK
ncbi:holin [Paeniglutamicibacter sp. ANT13_2]|uniref:Holin n=1 Tax=Paeniglutamicibacter terrestris TaxID=2723403 RepID=A0ABX1G4E9_9MICC|nr:holin [Paeniglutamicibacter terrestris]